MAWDNFGDVSVNHGQVWIGEGDSDYAECVEILSGSDVGLADNQYMIRKGSIYFSPDRWNDAMSTCDMIHPPTFKDVAYAFFVYQGMDLDTYGGFTIVQIGKELDDWTARGTTHESDVILHGNASIEKYLESEYLT